MKVLSTYLAAPIDLDKVILRDVFYKTTTKGLCADANFIHLLLCFLKNLL